MSRLSGLLLMIRALAPVLAVGIIYWGYTRMIGDFQSAISLPLSRIEAEMAALGETINTAQTQFEVVRADVEDAVQVIQGFQIPDLLPNLSSVLTIPSITIPDLDVPILPTLQVNFTNATGSISRTIEGACRTVFDFFGIGNLVCDPVKTITESLSFSYPSGLSIGVTTYRIDFPTIPSFTVSMPAFFGSVASGLEGIFAGFNSVFEDIEQTFSRLNALGQQINLLPANFTVIGESGQQMLNNLTRVVVERAGLVTVALLAAAALIVVYYVTGALRDLLRGLRLLVGL